jgi:hypothetical protein
VTGCGARPSGRRFSARAKRPSTRLNGRLSGRGVGHWERRADRRSLPCSPRPARARLAIAAPHCREIGDELRDARRLCLGGRLGAGGGADGCLRGTPADDRGDPYTCTVRPVTSDGAVPEVRPCNVSSASADEHSANIRRGFNGNGRCRGAAGKSPGAGISLHLRTSRLLLVLLDKLGVTRSSPVAPISRARS